MGGLSKEVVFELKIYSDSICAKSTPLCVRMSVYYKHRIVLGTLR